MTNNELIQALDRLQKAMRNLDKTDEESRKRLSQLINDINRKLASPENLEHDNRLLEQLKDAVVHFKVKHPVITETIDEIKMALYSIGL
jgi:predicted transcriptional regulator